MFGVAIGNFQLWPHRMVDMFIECEQMRSLLYIATLKLAECENEAKIAAAALKVQLGKAG